MKKVGVTIVNASNLPKGLNLPETCIVNTYLFPYNQKFLEQCLADGLQLDTLEDEYQSYILVTLSRYRYNKLTGPIKKIFESVSW